MTRGDVLPTRAHEVDDRLADASVVAALLLPLYVKLLLLPPTVGNDSQTHAYKTARFVDQLLSSAPLTQVGIYDWSWYAGYEFLQVYAPLFYGVTGTLSLLGLDPLTASHLVAAASFAVGAAAVYATVARAVERRRYAAVATAAYVYFPTHLGAYIQFGGLPRTLAVGLAPLAFYLMVRYLESGRRRTFLAWVLCGAAVALSNHGVGFVFTLATGLFLLVRRRAALGFLYGVYVALLSLFVLVPYATYDVPSDLPVVPPDVSVGTVVQDVVGGGGSGVLLLVAFLLVVTWAVRRGRWTWRRDGVLVPSLAVVVLFVVYNVVAYVSNVGILQIVAYNRSTPVFVVFGSVTLGLALERADLELLYRAVPLDRLDADRFQRGLVGLLLVLVVAQGLTVGAYSPTQPDGYQRAYDAIDADSESWSRWVLLPREPVAAFSTDRVGKPTIGGWYVQGMHDRLYGALGSTMNPQFIKLERRIAYGDTERSIDLLEYLGVEYVVVERYDPPIGFQLSNDVHEAMIGAEGVRIVEQYGSVTVYRIRGFSTMEGYRSRPETPSAFLDPTMPVAVERVEERPTERTFVFETPESGWVVLPVARMDSLEFTLDGEPVETREAYAGMTMVRVDAGSHRVTATPSVPLRTRAAIAVSAMTLLLLVLVGDRPLGPLERVERGVRGRLEDRRGP